MPAIIRHTNLGILVLLAFVIGLSPACANPDSVPPTAPPSDCVDNGIDWALSPEQIDERCVAELGKARVRVEAALNCRAQDRSPMADLVAIETAIDDLERSLIAPVLLAHVSDDSSIRDASAECSQSLAEFHIELAADPQVFQLAQEAFGQAAKPADRQLATIYIEAGRRTGAGLETAKRAVVKELFSQLESLEMEYMQALGMTPTTIEISQDEASTLANSFVETFSQTAEGYVVPVNFGTLERFLTTQGSGDARKRFYLAFYNIGGQANVDRLEQALVLRHRLSQLLGFDSWAAYRLDNKMAKTPERALFLLHEIAAQLLPLAREEIRELARLKESTGDTTPFAAWDDRYFADQLARSRYGVDNDTIREYFPADFVVPAIMKLYGGLFAVRFEQVAPAHAWAADVLEYTIIDQANEKLIGRFFLDLVPRPGKALHFSSYRLRAGRELADGRYQTPVAAIIGNGPASSPGQTATFSHTDVLIFFHEFGHLMHDTLSKAPYASLHGTNVRDDFVEAPSQMLENWVSQPVILKKISRHVTTGEPMPDEVSHTMIARKHLADGAFWTRQAFFGIYDLTIHDSGPEVDTGKLWTDLRVQYMALPPVADTVPQASFAGLMGGYDAGYYGYIWSKVYALDMFTEFQRFGLENPEIGARYRREILEPGGVREPVELVETFLGRPVSFAAFYAELGLARPSHQLSAADREKLSVSGFDIL